MCNASRKPTHVQGQLFIWDAFRKRAAKPSFRLQWGPTRNAGRKQDNAERSAATNFNCDAEGLLNAAPSIAIALAKTPGQHELRSLVSALNAIHCIPDSAYQPSSWIPHHKQSLRVGFCRSPLGRFGFRQYSPRGCDLRAPHTAKHVSDDV